MNANIDKNSKLSNDDAITIVHNMIQEIIKSDGKTNDVYENIITNLKNSENMITTLKYNEFDKEIPSDYKIKCEKLLIFLKNEKYKLFKSYYWTQTNLPKYIEYVFYRISNIIINWYDEFYNCIIRKNQEEIYNHCENLLNDKQLLKIEKNILESNTQYYNITNVARQKEIDDLIEINKLKFKIYLSFIKDTNKIIELKNYFENNNIVCANTQNIIDGFLEIKMQQQLTNY